MNRDDIHLLFRYSDWANDRILDTAELVSLEQLAAESLVCGVLAEKMSAGLAVNSQPVYPDSSDSSSRRFRRRNS